MEQNKPLEAVEQHFLFTMAVVCADMIVDCRVFDAALADGTRFTRVMYQNLGDERIIDLDYWEEVGWVDLWYGEPSPWSFMVAPSLDYHFAQNKKAGQ